MAQTVSITINGREFSATPPPSWDALDNAALLQFYAVAFAETTQGSASFTAALTNLQLLVIARALLGIGDDDLKAWEADCIAGEENGEGVFAEELRAVVHALIEGLFDIATDEETRQTTYAIRLNRLRCPYPELIQPPKPGRYRSRRLEAQHTRHYHAPADGLGNLSIYELAATFSRFEAYLATGDERHALELLAILYRPPKAATKENREQGYEGDIRQPYRHRENVAAQRVPLVASLPLLVRRVLLFWFASCRAHIVKQYPKVFSAPAGEGSAPGYGWAGVLLSVAGGPAGLDAVADQHYSNTLTWLSMKAEEADEMDRRVAAAAR